MKHENTKNGEITAKKGESLVFYSKHKILFVRIPRELDNGVMNIGVLKNSPCVFGKYLSLIFLYKISQFLFSPFYCSYIDKSVGQYDNIFQT